MPHGWIHFAAAHSRTRRIYDSIFIFTWVVGKVAAHELIPVKFSEIEVKYWRTKLKRKKKGQLDTGQEL